MPAVTEPPGLLMYSQMSWSSVLALEVQQLGADLVGDVVVDGGAEHDHPVAQQAVEDVGAGVEPGLEHLGRDGSAGARSCRQATARVLHRIGPVAPIQLQTGVSGRRRRR